MAKVYVLGTISREVAPNSSETIALTKSFVAQSYVLTFTLKHDNAQAIPATVTPIGFFERIIRTVRLDAGASRDIINLSGAELLARMLHDDGMLIYNIDRTAGNGKESTFTVIVNIYDRQGIVPKDTALNTTLYEHLNFIIKAGDLDDVSQSSLKSISVDIREQQKAGVVPLTAGGKAVALKHRKPLIVRKAFTADDNNLSIPLPTRAVIKNCMLFVMDANEVKTSVIEKASLKILQNYRIVENFNVIHNLNRLQYLKKYDDTDYNGMCIIDFSQGELSQAINTSSTDENYGEMILSVKKGTLQNPTIVAVFETVENA